jgi:pimeloyl-ACP methyl ester carboxylesterase
MFPNLRRVRSSLAVGALLFAACSGQSSTPAAVRDLVGSDHGAVYKISVPNHWNGTLLVYSHGYIAQSSPGLETKFKKAGTGSDPTTTSWLLDHGYALAASLYAQQGWAVEIALKNQLDLLQVFSSQVGQPQRVIAWGASMGGLVSVALVEQHPELFHGALPLCGALAGTKETLNTGLDAVFALQVLLATHADLFGSSSSSQAGQRLQAAVTGAKATAAGRARLALAAALADLPAWEEGQREPSATDLGAHLTAEIDGLIHLLGTATAGESSLASLAGGNPLSNVGVDYGQLLDAAVDKADVQAAYAAAGLDLTRDLGTLNGAQRIAPDSAAASYISKYYTPTGNLQRPVLTLHTSADAEAPVANEGAYRVVVGAAGQAASLQQLFVHRAGHCAFSPAETVTALQQLVARVGSGRWPVNDPTQLNAGARRLGSSLNSDGQRALAPAFEPLTPTPLPRTVVGSSRSG